MYFFSATCLLCAMIMVVGASPIPTSATLSLSFASTILLDPPISKGATDLLPQGNGSVVATAPSAAPSAAPPAAASPVPDAFAPVLGLPPSELLPGLPDDWNDWNNIFL
ncbi:hypothetical protein B0H14DRAFT_3053194 [Mycena olivaceomarginata]|nr:hypothetical protein B0H14DRAFT_3053194 [Mycena olivaceomarginata]